MSYQGLGRGGGGHRGGGWRGLGFRSRSGWGRSWYGPSGYGPGYVDLYTYLEGLGQTEQRSAPAWLIAVPVLLVGAVLLSKANRVTWGGPVQTYRETIWRNARRGRRRKS